MTNRFTTWISTHKKISYIAVVCFVLAMVAVPYISRMIDYNKKYDWEKWRNYGKVESTQPFGTRYFDEHIRSYWKQTVEVDSSFEDFVAKHGNKPCNAIVYMNYFDCTSDENEISFYKSIGLGSNVILVDPSTSLLRYFDVVMDDFIDFDIDDFKGDDVSKSHLIFSVPNSKQKDIEFDLWKEMLDATFYVSSVTDTTDIDYNLKRKVKYKDNGSINCIRDNDGNIFALMRKIGKGKVVCCGIPLMYCNYGMSVLTLQNIGDGIMNETFDKKLPLVVVYKQDAESSGYSESYSDDTLFYVLIEHKQTALALYFMLAMLMLWIIFNSRRRRKAVAQVKREKNTSIDYIKHIATLYTHKSDYKDLLKIEHRKLLYKFREDYRFDITTRSFSKLSDYSEIVACSNDLDKSAVRLALLTLEEMTEGSGGVSRKSYLYCLKLLECLNK